MSDLSNKFIYEEREIDKDLVEAACKWNTTKADRAHLIYLNSKPKHGNTSLLRHLEQDLSYRGFRALFIDPKQNNSIYAPCSLAAALHNALSDNRLHVLKQGIYELLHGSIGVMFSRLMLIIIWLVTFIIYKYSGDASFSSPYIHNFFYNFLSVKNIMKLVVEFFGWTTALIIILKMVFRTQPFFDEKAAKEFAETGAYFRKIAKFGRGRTVALLIDNAKDIDLATEINIINHLLNSDTEYDSRIGLPKDFRILIVTLGQLPGLRLGGKSPEEFKIPKLSATIERDCTAIAMRVRQKIDEFLTTAKFKRRTGRMGTHEWMAYEAELDRPTITRQELQALYAEVIRSDIMPLLGLKGPHPSKPPATILRENRPFPFKMDFGSVYFSEARKFFSEHHIDLVAKARLMLAIPGICRIRSGEQWRDWGPEAHREVLYAADHAKDLSDSDVTGQDVFTLLQGDNNRRLKVIIELMDLLVTAAEIQMARGQLVKAVAYLYSAGNWFGTVEQTIPESLQSRFLYELWTNFWFSCEVEHRTWIHDFETKHPRVKESNTWKILTNYERRLQGQPLAEDVSDPGMINPELSNIFQLTKLAELLIKIYGDDIDEAAISETVDIGIVYQELYPTYFGILLAGIQCNLLYRRGEVCSALEQIKKKIAGQYDNIRSDWMGYRLIIDFRLAVDKVVDLWWHRSSVDPAKLIGMQDELLARVIELRDLAVLIGFRLINMEASYNLAWINQMRIQYEPPLNEDDIKLVPIIERYFQLVLNHEKGLGWVNRTPKIFGHRIFLLENTDKDPIVDDQVGLYHAAKHNAVDLRNFPGYNQA